MADFQSQVFLCPKHVPLNMKLTTKPTCLKTQMHEYVWAWFSNLFLQLSTGCFWRILLSGDAYIKLGTNIEFSFPRYLIRHYCSISVPSAYNCSHLHRFIESNFLLQSPRFTLKNVSWLFGFALHSLRKEPTGTTSQNINKDGITGSAFKAISDTN